MSKTETKRAMIDCRDVPPVATIDRAVIAMPTSQSSSRCLDSQTKQNNQRIVSPSSQSTIHNPPESGEDGPVCKSL